MTLGMAQFEIFSRSPSEGTSETSSDRRLTHKVQTTDASRDLVLEDRRDGAQSGRTMMTCDNYAMLNKSVRTLTNTVELLESRLRRLENTHKLDQSRLDRRLSHTYNRLSSLESNAARRQAIIRMGLMLLEEKFRKLEMQLDYYLCHLKHLHPRRGRPSSVRSWPAGAYAHGIGQ